MPLLWKYDEFYKETLGRHLRGKKGRGTDVVQSYPDTSVDFLNLFDLPLPANIIDIGGGDSRLADVLLVKGYKNMGTGHIGESH